MKSPDILIIDGNSLAYRCLYAHKLLKFKNKTTNEIIYTGVSYGFITNLIALNSKFNPSHIFVVWDGGSNRRSKMYTGYKYKRKEKRKKEAITEKAKGTYRNILEEIMTLQNILQNIGIQQFRTIGEEADDVIGALVKKYQKHSMLIVSPDHDFNQLLQFKNVKLMKPADGIIYTKRKFIKQFGFHPKYYPNALALGGDTTDEYPGVKGISLNTAITILNEYGPLLKDIIKHANKNDLKNKRHCVLINQSLKMIWLCRKLAKIYYNVNIDEINPKFDTNKIKEKFKELKFHSLLFEDKFSEVLELNKKGITL